MMCFYCNKKFQPDELNDGHCADCVQTHKDTTSYIENNSLVFDVEQFVEDMRMDLI